MFLKEIVKNILVCMDFVCFCSECFFFLSEVNCLVFFFQKENINNNNNKVNQTLKTGALKRHKVYEFHPEANTHLIPFSHPLYVSTPSQGTEGFPQPEGKSSGGSLPPGRK